MRADRYEQAGIDSSCANILREIRVRLCVKASGLRVIRPDQAPDAQFNEMTTRPSGIGWCPKSPCIDQNRVMSKNLNKLDIGGPERGSCLETGFGSPACPGTQPPLSHGNRAGIRGSPDSDQRPYPPVVLLIASNTCSFRPPDDDSSSAFHPSESGTGRLQRCERQAVPG